MKYFLYRTAAFVCILILCTLVPGIALNQIFILEEFLLVICGAVLFSLIPVLQEIKKGNRVLFSYAVSLIAKNAFVSGVFISLIFILSDINTAALLGDEDGVVTSLIMLENMRPFLYGAFLWIILYTKKSNTDNCTVSEKPESVSAPVLSRREEEVARLASSGLSNLQIADRLFISEATVKRHLATIFQKTGVNSRRELAKLYENRRR